VLQPQSVCAIDESGCFLGWEAMTRLNDHPKTTTTKMLTKQKVCLLISEHNGLTKYRLLPHTSAPADVSDSCRLRIFYDQGAAVGRPHERLRFPDLLRSPAHATHPHEEDSKKKMAHEQSL
jgi:hypothetical protein